MEEQFHDILFEEQRTAEYSHDLNDWAIEVEPPLNDSNKAIRDDCHMDLDSNSILGLSPEGFDTKMLLDPFEEQLNLPSVAIKLGNILGSKIEVICVVSKGSLQVWCKVDNTSDSTWIVALIPLTCESYGLIIKNIILSIEKFFPVHNFIFRSTFLTDDEESHRDVDCIESCQVKVTSVKDIAGVSLISDPVHCVDIVDDRIGDSVEYWYLGNDINLRVDFNARLGASEFSPSKYRHTEVDSCGVNCIKSAMKFEVFRETQVLSDGHHIKGKFFEYSMISDGVSLGQYLTIDSFFTKPEEKRFLTMCNCDICEFSQTAATYKLPKQKNQHVIPMRKRPTLSSIVVFLNDAPELALWQKRGNLCENVLSNIHICGDLNSTAKVKISKPGQYFEQLIYCE